MRISDWSSDVCSSDLYLAKMLTLAGESNAEARASAVFDFEKALATAHWDNVKTRDADLNYNIWKPTDFTGQAGDFPWGPYFDAAGVAGQAEYPMGQPSAFSGEAKAVDRKSGVSGKGG